MLKAQDAGSRRWRDGSDGSVGRAGWAGLLGVLLALPALADGPAPPDGTTETIRFCGEIYESQPHFELYGIRAGVPYLGQLTLTQRSADFNDPHSGASEWDCEGPGGPCGEFRVFFPEFVPPQTVPDVSDVFGPVSAVDQTDLTYRLNANLDGFVTGPGELGAVGIATLEIICPTCNGPNNQESIFPDFRFDPGEIAGDVRVQMQVPGIGGSLAPPGGGDEVRMSILDVGNRCRRILPTSSPWGLVALVAGMVTTAIFFGGRRLRE